MTGIHWTPRLIQAHLVEAAQTLRRLPGTQRPRAFETWPGIVRETWAANVELPTGQNSVSPRAIAQMNTALLWLHWLDERDQRAAWDRARGRPWKAIAHDRGVDRTTAWRQMACAFSGIAGRLNADEDAATLQQRSA